METPDNLYVDFAVTARKYKTLLTNKYKNRPVWTKPCVGEVRSTLPGTVVQITVKEGQRIEAGDLLLSIDAMKMQNRILASEPGIVTQITVKEGDKITKHQLLLVING
ncbi:MAG: acetyl-CoA carboxylase biotin carboxyl carrier protein subunit [Tannerellaceae bacterium]|jgi:biotin carboxyl carrier protein|nr:acetyl-CoA carboxylase biotin carboxyl carrier protein subunit [Tannerellaceae bacterium]